MKAIAIHLGASAIAITACTRPSASIFSIHTAPGVAQFDRIELFFVDPADRPLTAPDDVAMMPHSTPRVAQPITSPTSTTMRIRKFNPEDIYLSPTGPIDRVGLAVPGHIGVAPYVAIVATRQDAQGIDVPVGYGEVTSYDDNPINDYEVVLAPIPHTAIASLPPPQMLDKLQWLAPCVSHASGQCTTSSTPDQTFVLGGRSSDVFAVTARIQGVMQLTRMTSGAIDGWGINGVIPGGENAFELKTSSPLMRYDLNPSLAIVNDVPIRVDTIVTFLVYGDATVFIGVIRPGLSQYDNPGLTIPGIPVPGNAPYDGQFAQLDILSIENLSAPPTDWPDGLEVWKPYNADQGCLRLTHDGATSFVVTDGDRDCDSFVDTEDCNPTRYCDPTNRFASADACSSTCIAHDTDMSSCSVGTCTNAFDSGGGGGSGSGSGSGGNPPMGCVPSPFAECTACDDTCVTTSCGAPALDLECVAMKHPDYTCAVLHGGSPDMTCSGSQRIQLPLTGCLYFSQVATTDSSFTLNASFDPPTCTLNLHWSASGGYPLVPFNAMFEVSTGSGNDTFTIEFDPTSIAPGPTCAGPQPPCVLVGAVHDCSS